MKTKMKKNPMMNESDFDITVPFNAKNKRSMDITHLDKTFHMVLVNHDVYRCTVLSFENAPYAQRRKLVILPLFSNCCEMKSRCSSVKSKPPLRSCLPAFGML